MRSLGPLFTRGWSFLITIPLGARIFWLWHFLVALGAWFYLDGAKSPEKMRFTKRVAEGLKPSLNDYVQMGLWKGAVVHLGISLFLLLTVACWARGRAATLKLRLDPNPGRWKSPSFLIGLGIIVMLGTALRVPRMTLSYWGDEGWAAEYYVHGRYEPVEEGQPQGELRLVPCTWREALWNDQNGGNHYFFSVLQMASLKVWRWWRTLPDTAFDEVVSRLVPLVAGLLTLILVALWAAWLGHRWLGLLLALVLALHPWHVRYSTEARGYALTLLFLVALIWLVMLALEEDHWAWWAGVALCSFSAVWSWKVSVLPVIALASVAGLIVLWTPQASLTERWRSLVRLVVAFLTGGALTAWLAMPPALQSKAVTERFQRMGKPMNEAWLKNSISGVHSGVPWQQSDSLNVTERPMTRALKHHPLLARAALAGTVLLSGLGLVLIFRRQRFLAWVILSWYLSMAAGAAYFKWGLRVEWIFWYFFPLVLPAMILLTVGNAGAVCWLQRYWQQRRFAGAVVISLLLGLTWVGQATALVPLLNLNLTQAYESHREAFALTRGKHEPWTRHGPFVGKSKIITCYMWRQIHLYDPRALKNVRDLPELERIMRQVDAEAGEFYYIVGLLAFSEATSPELFKLLRDDRYFEQTATLWAQEGIHTLHVFHYKRGSYPATVSS